MKVSIITGSFTDKPAELHKVYKEESYYLYEFEVEDGLCISVQVSQYLQDKVKLGVPVKLTGHLATCKKFSESKGRQAMFTFFSAKLIDTLGDNDAHSKQICCEGTVVHLYPLTVTLGGTEKLTIVVKESFDMGRVGIIHYTALGQLARKLSATIHEKDNVTGVGVLRQKTESLEVLLTDLKSQTKE